MSFVCVWLLSRRACSPSVTCELKRQIWQARHGSHLFSFVFQRKPQSFQVCACCYGYEMTGRFRRKTKEKWMFARNPFHSETSGDFTQVSHSEAALRRFFFPSTSKAICPNAVIQIKHPVNCTQAAGFFVFTRYTYTASIDLRGALVYSPEAPQSIEAGLLLSVECRRRRCDVFYTTQYMAISQTFTLQTAKKVWATSVCIEAHATQRGVEAEIDPLPVWVQQSMIVFGCLMNGVVLLWRWLCPLGIFEEEFLILVIVL